MRLFGTFLSHELRLQRRALRFRLIATAYLVASLTPAVVVAFHQRRGATLFGGATYAEEGNLFQPLLLALLALVLSLDGILRERGEGQWAALALTPLSNTSYLVHRWLALAALTLGLSILPMLGTLVVVAAVGAPFPQLSVLVLPWALHSAPVALLATALGLAAGTIAGGEITAVGLLLVLLLVGPGTLNTLLAHSGRKLTEPTEILNLAGIRTRTFWYELAVREGFGMAPVLPISEGGADARAMASEAVGLLLPAAALAFFVFALAPAFLQRCRRDLAPWRIPPDHSLRTILLLLNRARQTWSPDAGLAPSDRWLLAMAPTVVVVFAAVFWARDVHYRSLAERRYAAENSVMAPTPSTVVPVAWHLVGELDRAGSVSTRVVAEVANQGTRPEKHLAFSLSPELVIGRATVNTGALELDRQWDRLGVELTPPLSPGERRSITLSLRGRPVDIQFKLPNAPGASFATRWQWQAKAHLPADLADLSGSWELRHASPRRIDLVGSDLFPVPRYSSWELTPPPSAPGEPGLEVPVESISPEASIDFDLQVPTGHLLAEPCGGHVAGNERRLRGRCRLALDRWGVLGAALQPIREQPYFAVLKAHESRARLHIDTLATIPAEVEEAWPRLGLKSPLLLEWPPAIGADPWAGMGNWSPWSPDTGPQSEARGRLLLIPERFVVGARRISAENLVAELVSRTLLNRREVAPSELVLIRNLLQSIVRRRLGLGSASGAVLIGRDARPMRFALTEAVYWDPPSLAPARLDAVVADLEHRVGAPALRRGIEAFLSRRGAEPGTLDELISTIGSTAGLSLDRFEQEEIRGKGLPELGLVEVRTAGHQPWRVSGAVHNAGTGEALCTVVVETEGTALETAVRVEGGASAPFAIDAASPPRRVTLDPDQLCLRFHPAIPGAWRSIVELHPEVSR